jgi:hypothetical protein
MARRLNDKVLVTPAIENSGGGGPAAIVATKVNATGFSRARFIFQMGSAATTGSLQAGLGVWQAATSGAAYALVGSAAGNTSGALSGGANNTVVIDVPVSPASPWLQLSGSFLSTSPAHGAVVELYSGVNLPPTHTELQVVVV